MNSQEVLYTIALTLSRNINLQAMNTLMQKLGSATAIFDHRQDIRDVLPDAHVKLVKSISSMETMLKRAEEEMAFAQKSQIQCLCMNDENYPARLRECPDAPIMLYYRGNANLNAKHIVSIVGTRQITEYGKDVCRSFLKDLSEMVPDTLIVSGLAYGVDIHAQRAALENRMNTVGVLAHGLDQIYPQAHRDSAIKMLSQGGLLTEYPSHTPIDKRNFVQRNRIVAGGCDACIVVESAIKGGSLITAEIAGDYNKDVFAFPGRAKDMYSAGCNDLIRKNKAMLITSAEDFVQNIGWEKEADIKKKLSNGIQQQLFPDLSEEETRIIDALADNDGMQINMLTVKTALPIGKLTSLLFGLEMKGLVKMMSGGMYRIIR